MSQPEGTCKGKHDKQLEKEMNAVFSANLVECRASFERRRGRVTLVCYFAHRDEAVLYFTERHPDFEHSYDNPPIGDKHFLIFKQKYQ